MIRYFVLTLIFASILGGFYWTSKMPIDTISIQGNLKNTNYTLLQETIKQNLTGSFFTVDMDNLIDKIKQVPWILDVQIKKIWPQQINVNIIEREILALYNKDQVLTTDDVLLPKPKKIDKNILQIHSKLPIKFDDIMKYKKILNKYKFNLLAIKQADNTAISLKINQGIWLKIGTLFDETTWNMRLKIINGFLRKRNHMIKVIDMRYPRGMAVTRH
jgi:cell division protein FtsQ